MSELLDLLNTYETQQETIEDDPEIIFSKDTWEAILEEAYNGEARDKLMQFFDEEGVDNWSGYDEVQSRYLDWLDTED